MPTYERNVPHRPAPSVLIVDDDPEIREVLALTLGDEGYHVRQAASGRAALASLRGVGPADLVLLDLLMPGMGGLQLCAELRRDPELATIPVVLCTASSEGREAVLRAGAAAYVAKPFDNRRLLETVARLCRPAERAESAYAAAAPM